MPLFLSEGEVRSSAIVTPFLNPGTFSGRPFARLCRVRGVSARPMLRGGSKVTATSTTTASRSLVAVSRKAPIQRSNSERRMRIFPHTR